MSTAANKPETRDCRFCGWTFTTESDRRECARCRRALEARQTRADAYRIFGNMTLEDLRKELRDVRRAAKDGEGYRGAAPDDIDLFAYTTVLLDLVITSECGPARMRHRGEIERLERLVLSVAFPPNPTSRTVETCGGGEGLALRFVVEHASEGTGNWFRWWPEGRKEDHLRSYVNEGNAKTAAEDMLLKSLGLEEF